MPCTLHSSSVKEMYETKITVFNPAKVLSKFEAQVFFVLESKALALDSKHLQNVKHPAKVLSKFEAQVFFVLESKALALDVPKAKALDSKHLQNGRAQS